MSWQYTAQWYLKLMSEWSDLSERERRMLCHLLQWYDQSERWEHNMWQLGKVSGTPEGTAYCWGCGTIEYVETESQGVPEGWIWNARHCFSGVLCPKCQANSGILATFTHERMPGEDLIVGFHHDMDIKEEDARRWYRKIVGEACLHAPFCELKDDEL
jgi:hypothetical protein